MKRFFQFSLAYLAVAFVVLLLFRDQPFLQLYDALFRTARQSLSLIKYLPYILGTFIVLYVATKQFASKRVAAEIGWALAGCLVFSSAFTFMKTSLPYVMPFYADPFFAELDKALHGGVDPWILTHMLSPYISASAVSTLYFPIWGLPAGFFPLILATLDNDPQRRQRYLFLFGFVWIGLGNVLAYLGSSVGPVYYERLLGVDRYPGMREALFDTGIMFTKIGAVQDGLWRIYAEYAQTVGSGITAFPSVHNGIAAMTMLYLWERSRWLAPVGILFSAAILFCSVYIGWHYAVDGYFSLIAVVAAWYGIRRWQARSTAPKEQHLPQGALA